jgi:hypothetical protein
MSCGSLVQLPPELVAVVCRHLPRAALAALEFSCRALHCRLARAGVWRDRLLRLEREKSYSVVSRALHWADKNGMTDERVFKVLLGLRRIIRTTVYSFSSSIYKPYIYQGVSGVRITRHAMDKFLSKKILQIKSWSKVMFEDEAEYKKCVNHEEIFDEAFENKEIDVKACLGRLERTAAEHFQFDLQEAITTVQNIINPM